MYKVTNLLFLEALQVCRKIMAPFTGLVRLIASGRLLSGVGEWCAVSSTTCLTYPDLFVDCQISRAQTLQTLGTVVGEQIGKLAREKLNLPTELFEHLQFEEGTLESAWKG